MDIRKIFRIGNINVIGVLIIIWMMAVPINASEFPKLHLNYGHFLVANMPGSTVDQWFADELSKRTNGRITMKIFWAESMGKSMELLDMAGKRGVDISSTAAVYFPSQIPFMAAAGLPVFKSARQAKIIWNILVKEFPAFHEEARSVGVFPLLWHPIAPYHLICNKPIRSLEDMKGKKFRSYGEDFPRTYKAIGAVPVTVLSSEWYESLQRGSVDCMMHSWDTLATYKLHEAGKYASMVNFGAIISWPQWWNLKLWESLPAEVKKLVIDLAAEADAIELDRLDKAEKEAINTMKSAGVEFIPFPDQSELEALTPDLIGGWVTKMEKLGKGSEAGAIAKRWKELLKQHQ